MGLVTPQKIDEFTQAKFPNYTPDEVEVLSKRYSPEQMAALQAGEAAIDPRDLTIQGRLRIDQYRLNYIDDFSTYQPVIDKMPRDKAPPDTSATWMTDDQFGDAFLSPHDTDIEPTRDARGNLTPAEMRARYGFQPDYFQPINEAKLGQMENEDMDFAKFWQEQTMLTGSAHTGNTALAPPIGDPLGLYKVQSELEEKAAENDDKEGTYTELRRQTGLSMSDLGLIMHKPLVQRFVSCMTRLGRVQRFSIVVAAGNGDGMLGLGVGNSIEASEATMMAQINAIRNMLPVRRYENRTIYGNVEAKYGATVVQLSARPPGFGLRVPARIFHMCRLAGIKDLACNFPRAKRPLNTVKAAYYALMHQPDPEEIAVARGQKLVDVRKVYYGGAIY